MSVVLWLAPLLALTYLIFVLWYSNKMVKALNTSYGVLLVIGILVPPIWILLALISLGVNVSENDVIKVSPKRKNSPKRK